MKGSVRRRGNKWEYYYRELHPGTGKWRQRSKAGFASRREAEAALRTVLSTMDAGNYVSPSSLSLGDYLTYRWLPSIKRPSAPAPTRATRGSCGCTSFRGSAP